MGSGVGIRGSGFAIAVSRGPCAENREHGLAQVFPSRCRKTSLTFGFTGVGVSVEDCLEKARLAMDEHVALLEERGLPVPPVNPNPRVVVQNQQPLAGAAGF